jgi:hypothetical protein
MFWMPWLVPTGKGKNTEAMLGRGKIPHVKAPDLRIFYDLLQAGNAVISEKNPRKGTIGSAPGACGRPYAENRKQTSGQRSLCRAHQMVGGFMENRWFSPMAALICCMWSICIF